MARKFIIILTVLIIVPNLMLVAFVFLGPKSSPPKPMPNPNGYDDFVKAAQILSAYNSMVKASNSAAYADTMPAAELATLLSSNQAALRLLHSGLAKESRFPMDYSPAAATNLLPPLASLKNLAWLFLAEGRQAELDGRMGDAANTYVEGVRFGQESVRGGLLISRLVGIACEAIATKRLQPLISTLDAPACRRVAQALETINTNAEPMSEVLVTEKLWTRKTYGLRGQFELLITYKMQKKSIEAAVAKDQRGELQRLQTMVAAAARAYELEKGKRLQSWTDLVPAYLKAVPKDPVTGKDMVLRP